MNLSWAQFGPGPGNLGSIWARAPNMQHFCIRARTWDVTGSASSQLHARIVPCCYKGSRVFSKLIQQDLSEEAGLIDFHVDVHMGLVLLSVADRW